MQSLVFFVFMALVLLVAKSFRPIVTPSFVRQMSVSVASSTGSATSSNRSLILSLREHLGNDKIRLILASQSPRRREILDMMGLNGLFDVRPSPLDETELQQQLSGSLPIPYTLALAEAKAKTLAETISSIRGPTIVLGSDTIVELDGCILEKPIDAADAKRMLTSLSGRQHSVHTGVALYTVSDQTIKLHGSFVDTASVEFAVLSDADVDEYIATGEPMDKAGSYGIQGIGGQLVSRITGEFFTVSFSWFRKSRMKDCSLIL